MPARRDDFPIFAEQPDVVYLDNGATVQKPAHVIDTVTDYMRRTNANIHRGAYGIAIESESLYDDSKRAIARLINARPSEIVYTHNATYGLNIIAQTLQVSGILSAGDVVLINIAEHHANIVPWQILARDHGVEVVFFALDDGWDVPLVEHVYEEYCDRVKVIASTMVSNVTGIIYDMSRLRAVVGDDVLVVADLSQAIQHMPIDVQQLGIDIGVRTGHKMMGMTGVGCVWAKKQYRQRRTPSISGGGAIKEVDHSGFCPLIGSQAREPGTPNIIGAVSMLAACEYIESIGGMQAIQQYEEELVAYTVSQWEARVDQRRVLGGIDDVGRVGTWTFVPVVHDTPAQMIGETMARAGVAIRAGGHCAHPLMHAMGTPSAARMSTYLYNTRADVDAFFAVLDDIY